MENGRVMAVKFLDLQKQYLNIKEEVDKKVLLLEEKRLRLLRRSFRGLLAMGLAHLEWLMGVMH